MPTGSIYKIHCAVNNKIYIGQTRRSIGERFAEHCERSRSNPNQVICRAIAKHGKDNFSVEELACVPEQFLNHLERVYIQLFNACDSAFGYNRSYGGEGQRVLEEVKEKIRASSQGKPKTKEHGDRISAGKKGKLSEASAAALAVLHESMRGRTITQEHKDAIGRAHKLIPRTQEWKDRISASLTGKKYPNKYAINKKKPLSAEARAQISATLKGHKQSAETIAKRAASIRATCAIRRAAKAAAKLALLQEAA